MPSKGWPPVAGDGSRHPTAVAIIEDDAGTAEGLRQIIAGDATLRCLGIHASVAAAVAALPDEHPDVVIVDVNLPDGTGVDCVRRLAPAMPDTEFVMLTVYQDADILFEALAAGAHGYLIKPVRAAELVDAIRDVVAGGAPLSNVVARRIVRSFERPATALRREPPPDRMGELSQREREVLELLSTGLLYKEIAVELGVSLNTVMTYMRRIYKKLHVTSRHYAVECYRRMK